jgi:hypothetical protein
MCREFFFPYCRKMWKRPLDALAAEGFHWNIERPDLREVLRGALEPDHPHQAYNANGWYPRPSAGQPRGMEVLSHGLAAQVADLRTGVEVTHIDTRRHRVRAVRHGGEVEFGYREALISTLPLPVTTALVSGLPAALQRVAAALPYNRVLTPCLRIVGPRPAGTGHWRYYADPELSFTRLVFMHEFDPGAAPPEGWGLMAEITEPAESEPTDPAETLARACRDVQRAGALPPGSRIAGAELITNPCGYVVFAHGVAGQVARLLRALRARGIEPLGRYGRWEYSSMGQVMRDGLALGERLAAGVRSGPDEIPAA